MDTVVIGSTGEDGGKGDGGIGQNVAALAAAAADATNNATADGGMGGISAAGYLTFHGTLYPYGAGAAGGSASAQAATTLASADVTSASASATGGAGGSGSGQPGVPHTPSGSGTHDGAGGDVLDTFATATNTQGDATATAIGTGGAGGTAAPGDLPQPGPSAVSLGYPQYGGDGGVAQNVTAHAEGVSNAGATVTRTGGAGGDGPRGGAGGASVSMNDVSGMTLQGVLSLRQSALGGAGGFGQFGPGGQGGAATASLTLDDTASAAVSRLVYAAMEADGGNSGSGANTPEPRAGLARQDPRARMTAYFGGAANALVDLTGATDVSATATAVGGDGGGTFGPTEARADQDRAAPGGAAMAAGRVRTTSATGNADVSVVAQGGAGGSATGFNNGTANGANGTTATALASAIGGASAVASVTAQGGSGGSSDGGSGGAGGAIMLIDAVSGTSEGGTLSLRQMALGGQGGDAIQGAPIGGQTLALGFGGNGGNATSSLSLDDRAQAFQSASIAATIQAQGGDSGYRSPSAGASVRSGNGGTATSRGTLLAAPTLASGASTEVSVQVSAFGGNGDRGGDATAIGSAAGGSASVTATSIGGSGFSAAGAARASAASTASSGTVIAAAGSTLYTSADSSAGLQVTARSSVFGTTVALASTGFGQTLALDYSRQAVATAVGNPVMAAGGTDLPAGDTLVLDAELGGRAASAIAGAQIVSESLSAQIDLSTVSAGSHLLLDFWQSKLFDTDHGGADILAITFNASAGNGPGVSHTFANGAAAAQFLSHNVVDLGAIDTLTASATSLQMNASLSFIIEPPAGRSLAAQPDAKAAGSGLYAEIQAAFGPAGSAPVPEDWAAELRGVIVGRDAGSASLSTPREAAAAGPTEREGNHAAALWRPLADLAPPHLFAGWHPA